ncbi:MAG: phage holin family protein [Maioricimonas sp. JB045]
MLDQKNMNGQRGQTSPAGGVKKNLAGLTHDLISLAELQAQLVAVDLRDSYSRSVVPAVLVVTALLLALGAMPVILLGIGWALVNLAGFGEGAAFLLVSLTAVGLAAATGWWGVQKLKASLGVLTRSRRELSENVWWIKQALLRQQTQSELYRRHV